LYAIALVWPKDMLTIKTLNSKHTTNKNIRSIELLGHQGELEWSQDETGLKIRLPQTKPCEHAFALKISCSESPQ
jgi:alpha-L-fucosidase